MSLKKIPYKTLNSLIRACISEQEFEPTFTLVRELRSVRQRKCLTKNELIKICKWKSARAIWHIRKNTPAEIRKITGDALATQSEKKRIELLTMLRGVSIPMASAILMLTNPKRYGVIDIRVWQLLYEMKAVDTNPGGKSFSSDQWCEFLAILRQYAKKHNVTARVIERTLFAVHLKYQKGNLYE